ncbi:hydrolase [Glaciecola sp. 1036]|uniref:hydrolase n=1 Tax=Alteromonadaceae TaxID=72275 RepID=UPI003D0193F4
MTFNTQFGKLSQAGFEVPNWARNSHIQTIWPKYFVKQPQVKTVNERINTPDGDFLDLAWYLPTKPKALVVAFHGLEGSINSHYIKFVFENLYQQGFGCVLMHFRGCSGEINLTSRAYHSGETTDPLHVINLLEKKYPDLPLFAVGFSLGGNMLLKLIANQKTHLKAAVAVSAPINLQASADAINQGFAKVYQKHLLKTMKQNMLKKFANMDMSSELSITPNEIKQLSSFWQFDQHITSKLHGYKNAIDYYEKASALPDLHKIKAPSLIIHAKDDPFMNDKVIPTSQQLSSSVAYELSQHGGHVGFMRGTITSPKMWLPQRISAFFQEQL